MRSCSGAKEGGWGPGADQGRLKYNLDGFVIKTKLN